MTDTPESTNDPGPDAVFQEKLSNGQFCIQRCADCGTHVFYPRLLCTGCESENLEWLEASGNGVVYSTSVIRRKPDRGGDYNIALIDLEEGPRLMSRVEGIDPAEVSIGMSVKARIATEDDAPLVVFDKA